MIHQGIRSHHFPAVCCALVVCSFYSASRPAEAASSDTLYLDEIVVTGTRNPRKVSDTPVRTEVVSREEIRDTHARTVKEALQNVPGLLLRQIHGKAGYEVWMQGFNADRILVLIDGLPLTATTGSSVDVTQLDTLDIERIEVVKGAVSAQYGSSAMGGVVNIITRPISKGTGGEFTVDGGTYGDQNPSGESLDFSRRNGQASLSLGGETVRWRLTASQRETDGIDPEPETWARPGDAVERTNIANRLEWLPADGHRICAQLGYFREDAESHYVETNPGNFLNAGKNEIAKRWRGALIGQHKPATGPEWHWSLLHENLKNTTDKYTAMGRFDFRDATHTVSRASGWTQFEPFSAHQLQLGTDLNHNSLEQYKDGNTELAEDDEITRNGKEFWFQNTWFAGDDWEWVLGARYQNDSDFGSHAAPKLNARYDLFSDAATSLYVRGGWGVGYRVPNLKERYYRFDHSQLGYIVNGDPTVEPEESDSYQLGLGITFTNKAWMEVNGFYNDIDQLIQTELDTEATAARNDGVQIFRYANVERARTHGVELTAGWQIQPGWKVSAGYTYLDTEDLKTGEQLTRRPRHQGLASIDGLTPLPGMSWLARVRSQSDDVVDAETNAISPGFTTLDLKLNQDIGQHLRLFTGINNVTDAQRNFNDSSDFGPVSGRFIYVGLTLGFGNNL